MTFKKLEQCYLGMCVLWSIDEKKYVNRCSLHTTLDAASLSFINVYTEERDGKYSCPRWLASFVNGVSDYIFLF
jgi:hypothetical protein